MALVRGHIPDLSGGISTVPDVLRTPSEVKDALNVLFSPQRGAYRRPGTRKLGLPSLNQYLELGTYVWKNDAWVYEETGSHKEPRAVWVFPVDKRVAQVVMLRDRVWEMFWIDFITKDFLQEEVEDDEGNKSCVFVTPEHTASKPRNLGSNPILWGPRDPDNAERSIPPGSTPSDYMEIVQEEGQEAYPGGTPWKPISGEGGEEPCRQYKPRPQEAFRVLRADGRLYFLNRTKKVGLTQLTAPGNTPIHSHHYLVQFIAVTSGNAVKCKVDWNDFSQSDEADQPQTQTINFGTVTGVETMGEDFREKWSETSGIFVSALGNVMALRNLNPGPEDAPALRDFKFTFTNVAALVITEEDPDLKALPTLDALPPHGCQGWVLKVRGSVTSKLDDVWVRFSRDSERP